MHETGHLVNPPTAKNLVTEDGYATPEEAARGDIPARHARALSVSVSPEGDEAIVLLGTNEEPFLYPYEEHCVRGP